MPSSSSSGSDRSPVADSEPPAFLTSSTSPAPQNDDLLLEDKEAEEHPPDIEATTAALNRGGAWPTFTLTALLVLVCIYTLYLAKDFLAPVILAIVFNFLLSPFVRALKKL